MANVIVIKKGAGVPSPDSLEQAELALDTTNGDLYTKLADDSVALLNDGADDVDLSDYVKEAPEDGKQYARKDAGWSEIVIPDGGTGSSVHIGENPPADPQEGQQWMEVPTDGDAVMWIYDGAVWLEQPSNASGGDVDLSEYSTTAEADLKYQPKGDYLTDFTEEDPTVPSYVKTITEANINNWNAAHGWGNHADEGYATEAWVNAKNYSTYTGADAVKTSGNQTIGGAKTFSSNVTAPDFVATSDERAKDNITTAPVGLIDSLKGREWEWKESGEKGSGVVAQELEEVLPHLVHTDDDGMKSVAYNGLLAYLIEEIKLLRAEVEALK